MNIGNNLDVLKLIAQPLIQSGKFDILTERHDEKFFGNALLIVSSESIRFRLIMDRGQLFADIASLQSKWFSLNSLLKVIGISPNSWKSASELEGVLQQNFHELDSFLKAHSIETLGLQESPS